MPRISDFWPDVLQRWFAKELSRLPPGPQKQRLDALAKHLDMKGVAAWLEAIQQRSADNLSGQFIEFLKKAYKAPETWEQLKATFKRDVAVKKVAHCSRMLRTEIDSNKSALRSFVHWFGRYPGSMLDENLTGLVKQLCQLEQVIDSGFELMEGFWAVPGREDAQQAFCYLYLADSLFVDFAEFLDPAKPGAPAEPPFKEVAITVSCLLDREVTAQQVKKVWKRHRGEGKSRTIPT